MKKIILLIISGICIALIAGYVIIRRPQSMKSKFDITNASKVYIVSGNTGNVENLDKDQISKLQKIIENVQIKRVLYEEPRAGWYYQVVAKVDGSNLSIRVYGDRCSVNNDKKYDFASGQDALTAFCAPIVEKANKQGK